MAKPDLSSDPSKGRKKRSVLDSLPPRRRRFVELYANPDSPTFGNATQSYHAISPATTYGSAAVLASRELKNVQSQEAIGSVLAERGLTRSHIADRLKFALDDDAPQVRSSLVRAAEVALRAYGDLGPDTNLTVDARSIQLAPGESDALREQLRRLASDTPPG